MLQRILKEYIDMKSRKIYIDFIKIIAIYMVLFTHTGERGFFAFSCRLDSVYYPLYLFITICIRVAVPLFFMASGALLLTKEESIKEILVKRFVKYLLSLIVFSMIVYVYRYAEGRIKSFSLSDFLRKLYSGDISVHFWYLYAYLAYVLMLPLIRKFAKSLDKNEFKWLLFMCLIINVIPIGEYIVFKGTVVIKKNFNFFITTNYLLYPLMGYYLDKIDSEYLCKKIPQMTVASLLAIGISCYMTHYKCSYTGVWNEESAQTFFNNLRFIPAGTLFCASKCFFYKFTFKPTMGKIISEFGNLTFGIYVLECIYREMTEPVFYFFEPYVGTFISTVIWIFIACLYGGLITYMLKHMPVIKQIL